jgi:hypothetical protein
VNSASSDLWPRSRFEGDTFYGHSLTGRRRKACTLKLLSKTKEILDEICDEGCGRCVMLAYGVSVAFAQKGETVKMVRIDPLTGLLGPVGMSQPRATSSSPRSSAARATRPA